MTGDDTDAQPVTPATKWERLEQPKSYKEAVDLAEKVLAARLDTSPRAKWRIRIDRPRDSEKPEFWLSVSNDGRTRAEFFHELTSADYVHSFKNMALAALLEKIEQDKHLPKGKDGRPKRESAALKQPAGQLVDGVIWDTCWMLNTLGWEPMSGASKTGGGASVFDAVAEAMRNLRRENNRYQGIKTAHYGGVSDAFYRVREKIGFREK